VRTSIVFPRLATRLLAGLALGLAACSQEPALVSAPDQPIGPLLAIGRDPVSGATIETNKDDYVPGEIVHVTGTGWQPNETVALFMTEDPETHQDVTNSVVADSTGAFGMHFYDVQDHDLGVTFTLTATGLTSGSKATVTFYDAQLDLSIATSPSGIGVTTIPFATQSNSCPAATSGSGTYTVGGAVVQVSNNRFLNFAVPSVSGYTYTGYTWSGSTTVTPASAPGNTALCVAGSNNNISGTITLNYVASNTAPVVSAGADAAISEGVTFSQNGSFTDPDANSWTATVDYGDGSGVQPLTLVGKTFALSHLYTDNGTFNATVTINDGTATGSDVVVVTVNNVTPVVSAGPDFNGAALSQAGSFTDPGADTWTATVDYGDGAGVQSLALVGKTFTLSHTYVGSGTYTVTVTVTDDDTGVGSDEVVVNVANTAPVVSAGADAAISEGGTFSQNGSFTDPDANSWTATVDYGDGSGVQPLTLVGKTFTLSHLYTDNGTFNATVTVNDGTATGSDVVVVTVNNVAPVVSAGADATINEGATFSRNGAFTDPGADTWIATVDYGDGAGAVSLPLVSKSFALSHSYADNGSYTVTVTVTDDDGGSDSDQVLVTVNNVAPVVSAGADAIINEGGTFSQNGSFTDPGADTWIATVDYGDGAGAVSLPLAGKTFALSHSYADNGSYTVTVTVTDDDGAPDSDQVLVTVNNVAPNITSVIVPLNPAAAGPNNVTVTWTFTDPGTDTWTCEISWDTGLSYEPATYAGSKTCGATKTLAAGIYSVTVKVTDDDGGSDTEAAATYIVVYDPNGGFVTGGGWITSPAGAYAEAPSLSGKATFGFVSKYLKGASTPTGNTEFQFHVAGMNFKSTVYEWLVAAGGRGQYKGSGTINGSGDYGFLLTAIDGQLNGGGGIDKFRIKIWDKGTNTIVYDNQVGALDDSPAATSISGGSIVIHTK